MYCGKAIPEKTRSISETPPIAIDGVMFWLEGATEVQDSGGIFGTVKIGRGFCVSFSLIDSSGQYTVSDGQLVLALGIRGGSSVGTDGLRYAKTGIFYDEIDIKKSDFRWETFTNFSMEWEQLSFTYRRLTPLLFAKQDYTFHSHLWFRTGEGKLFYSPGESCTWK